MKNHCHGKKRDGSGDRCHRPAGWGTPNAGTRNRPGFGPCKLHGGSTASHVIAGQREFVRQAAATYGTPVEIDPASALLGELHRSQGVVLWLQLIVSRLPEEEVVWIRSEEIDRPITDSGGGGLETKHKAAPNVWVQLYQTERAHLARVAKDCLGADAAGRMASAWEQAGAQLVAVFGRILDNLQLTPADRAAIPALLITELQALTEGRRPDAG